MILSFTENKDIFKASWHKRIVANIFLKRICLGQWTTLHLTVSRSFQLPQFVDFSQWSYMQHSFSVHSLQLTHVMSIHLSRDIVFGANSWNTVGTRWIAYCGWLSLVIWRRLIRAKTTSHIKYVCELIRTLTVFYTYISIAICYVVIFH